jgi:undecaprenyl diphosphate synthase
MKDYKSLIDPDRVPKHIAIIMDGNGRWAEKYSLSRLEGHQKGTEMIEPIVESAHSIGVKVLSLYAFSTENWIRPKAEVEGLFEILTNYIDTQTDYFVKKGAMIRICGFPDKLPESVFNKIIEISEKTKKNNKIILNMCFNYGGRQEIVKSVNKWLKHRKSDEEIDEKKLEKYLLTSGLPEVDLMIRTSGEKRLSNFLIWQLAYSEFYFTDVLWPDFKPAHFYKAIFDFQNRDRRYGGR